MKKILLILFITIGLSSLFAGVTVKDFFGKVKVKYAGESKWNSIEVGQELPVNALVSTGFNSQIVLDLGNALLDVLPLTRMTVNEITESQNTIKTSLFLNGGKIKADVGKIEGKANDFKIKSPVATASVRGTAFEFTGNTLKVVRGKVAFIPNPKKKTDDASGVTDNAGEEESTDEESTDGSDTTSDSTSDGTSAGIYVEAGGATEMASSTSTIVAPSTIATEAATVSASTKPEVIKTVTTTTTTTTTDTTTDDTPTATEVLEEATTFANITVSVSLIEE